MAHVGKLYPVHFRRDWNLDLTTNRTGWARAYAYFFPHGFGTLGDVIPTIRFVCIATDETSFQGLKYKSGPYPAGGRSLHVEFESSPATGYPFVLLRGRLIDSVKGDILLFAGQRVPGQTFTQLSTGSNINDYPQGALYSPGFDRSSVGHAILWPEWNNL